MQSHIIPPVMREKGNTGPKGVIEDYKVAKAHAEMRIQQEQEAAHAYVIQHSMATTTVKEDVRLHTTIYPIL